MRVRVSIGLDGQLALFVEEGSYAEAQELSRQLLAKIGQVAPFQAVNPPEQHRHDDQLVTLHAHNHAHHP